MSENIGQRMKCLFFDLDGTLTDIDNRGVEAIYDTVDHFGLRVAKTRVRQLRVREPSYIDVFQKLGFELTDTAFQYLTSAFVKRYSLSVVREGVDATLRVLSEKYTLVCVTSRETLAEVNVELRFLRIDRFFDYIVTRNVAAKHFGLSSLPFSPFHEQRKKLYKCALALTDCNPNDVVVVGDMGRELAPARELGITTIGFLANKARKSELRETSDFVISSMTQLQNVLLEIGESQLAPR